MNSNLKKLEELEKNLPARCAHGWPKMIVGDEESKAEAARIRREIENCPNCKESGAKGFFTIDISARHRSE